MISHTTFSVLQMESSVSNSYQRPDSRASSSSINESPLTNVFAGWAKSPDEVIERCASSEATIHIDLSVLDPEFQAKAKAQVLGNCYVKICDLADLVNCSKNTTESKAVKRPRDDSSPENNERFATARISTQGHHRKLTKKKHSDSKDSLTYNVRNVSETRLIVQKKSLQYDVPPCTPIRSEMEYEETDIEPLPGPSRSYNNPYFSSSVPTIPFPRKGHSIPRKAISQKEFHRPTLIPQKPPAVHKESMTRPELNSHIDYSKHGVNVGTQTEPQPQIEFLKRRISELELIIASNRSFQTPSPLLPKSQEDAGSALSTPPNSDSGSCTGPVDKKSESSSSKHNPTPTKSARIVINRLTENDLRQYGVSRNSSVSPTEGARPKKRPRLSSLSDVEQRTSKKSGKKINSTKKKSDLFGDDSDEDVVPRPKKILEKSQPLDMDDLNYDFNDDEVEESRLSTVDKQKKSNETNHRDKSSKSDKKERNSEKDRQKEKERKKKDVEKTKTGEHSKSSKEKSAKESSKSGKDQAAAGNVRKFIIPKLIAPDRTAPDPTGPGLLPHIQQSLDELRKGPTPPAQQTVSLRTPESVLPKNLIAKPTDLAKVPSTSNNVVEQSVASESFELSGKSAPTILCNPRESVKERHPKSVNFHEQLERVRVISPCLPLQDPEQIKEISSVHEKYIPIIMNDLTYEPKSSPRLPITGIRPFRPPNRRIEDDKLKTLTQERGGRRFYASSSSSSSDSEDLSSSSESSEEINTNKPSEKTTSETFPTTDLHLTVENQSIANGSSIIPEESSSNPTAQESVESSMSSSCINSDECYTPSSAVEPVSMISVAPTSDSGREDSSPALTEEHAQAATPKKLPIPSLAVPPSPRRQTPEPIPQVPSTVVNARSSAPMEEDDSEEDDILDLGLNDEETFAYEEEEPPPPKLPSNVISNAPAKIVFDRPSVPSPVKIAAPLNKANVPAAPVKPSVIQRNALPNVANAPFIQDDLQNNRGLCFDLVRSGECKVSGTLNKKCDFSHDLDSVLDSIKYLCNTKGNIQIAYRLVCCMTNIDSPLNKSLYENLGMSIVRTVINSIVMGNRLDYMSIALEMLCDRKLPLIREFVDGVVRQTPATSASVNHLVSLYERCQYVESHKMSLLSFNKIIAVLVDHSHAKNWEFICKVVENAVSYYPQSYQPTKEVLYFLFCDAHDQLRLERLCHLFSGIGPPVLVQLGPELRREILNRLRHFGLVHWYDTYTGIRRPMENEMHVMPNAIRPTQSQFVAPQQYPPNGMVNQPPHGPPMSLVNRAQHPSMPQMHQMQPIVRPPNFRSQLQPVQPLGSQRPLLPSPSLHRPQQPPPVFPVGVHLPQLPATPPVGVLRPQLPTASTVGLHRPQHPILPMGHPVVNTLYPPTTPPVTHSVRDPREKLTRPMPHENGIGPGPSSSVSPAASNPAPPLHVVSPLETKKVLPFIALEIPKPSHSLDRNLFEPESPEVEPVFQDEEEAEAEVEQARRVVIEPSRAVEDELLTKFNEQNFKHVAEWYLRCYTGERKCAMLAKLVHLIKTNPIYDSEDNNQEMSPGHIAFKILHSACVDEQDNPRVLQPRERQALFDLIFFVLYHFFQMSMSDDEEEKTTQEHLAKNFLELLVCFQLQLPMDDFIKHPGLLLFAAKCFLNVDWSKEEEVDFLDEVVPQVERAIIFLTEFHKFVMNIESNVNSNLVREELLLSDQLLQILQDFGKFPGFARFSDGVAGLFDDYNNAALTNKSLFQALLPSDS